MTCSGDAPGHSCSNSYFWLTTSPPKCCALRPPQLSGRACPHPQAQNLAARIPPACSDRRPACRVSSAASGLSECAPASCTPAPQDRAGGHSTAWARSAGHQLCLSRRVRRARAKGRAGVRDNAREAARGHTARGQGRWGSRSTSPLGPRPTHTRWTLPGAPLNRLVCPEAPPRELRPDDQDPPWGSARTDRPRPM